MDLKFKKQWGYDKTPGTVTFSNNTKMIGVANELGDIIEYGGSNLLDIKAPDDGSGSSGSLNIGDLMLAGDMSINRFAGINTDFINIEYSTDSGNSWQEYSVTNLKKANIFSINNKEAVYLGGQNKSETVENNRLKITINLPIPCSECYFVLIALMMFTSTNGVRSLYVTITADDKRVLCENRELKGWGGNNSIYFKPISFGGQELNYHKLTFEFWQEKFDSESVYSKNNAFVSSIFGYANNVHVMSSNLAKTGHLYRFEQNHAIFPLQVYGNGDFSDKSRFLTSSEIDAKIQSAFTWAEYN